MTTWIRFCVRNPFITLVVTAFALLWGWNAWRTKTVDAIPDISENQTVVLTEWPGRSPQDVEDQITYPLATNLAGVKGVKEIRGLSGFGFSQIYIVFDEEIRFFNKGRIDDFYEARTRVLEKLASIQKELPDGVVPELGPDATALGQVFWYTVEGPHDLATLRSVQDWVVRYELQTISGVAEVASAGGMVREYQIDVDPNLLRHYGVGLMDVSRAVAGSNLDVGAKTIEAGGLEYIVRGLGFIKSVRDIEETVVGVSSHDGFVAAAGMSMRAQKRNREGDVPLPGTDEVAHSPVRIRDIADVRIGPAFRRGALADDRTEQVGGVVVMRFGANPRDVIAGVRKAVLRMNDPANGVLPEGVRVVPFYDRTQLIDETINTLETALVQELWITVAVVLLFLLHVRSSLIIASTLPLAVLLAFIAMEVLGVDSNIMSLTGIAIAIGTMVDMGIVMTENIYGALVADGGKRSRVEVVEEAAIEVAPALTTAIATTIVSFIPIFFLTDQEGKLFRPLAWTKTFALAAAAIAGVLIIPVLCRLFLKDPADSGDRARGWLARWAPVLLALPFAWLAARANWLGLRAVPAGGLAFGAAWLAIGRMSRERLRPVEENPVSRRVALHYERALRWILAHKLAFFVVPTVIFVFGILVTVGGTLLTSPGRAIFGAGFDRLRVVRFLDETFPGIGQEFMPPLDEGSLLYMPSLLPQAGLDETLQVMRRQNQAMRTVPEVARVVGKLGRAESALDPAPVGMLETVVQLKPKDQWRKGFTKDDVRRELMAVVHTPGATEGAGAWLQPIETRVIMLNSGIRAPLAVKLIGDPRDAGGIPLETKAAVQKLEAVAGQIRDRISSVPGVAGPNVENIGSKPYVEFDIHRDRVGHYGLTLGDVQHTIMTAIGGTSITKTLEGRERYSVRVAYARELRDRIDAFESVLVRGAGGVTIPISEVATIREVVGPAMIKTEDGRLRLHVTFAASGRDEGRVMEDVLAEVERWRSEHMDQGHPDPIPVGVGVEPAGRYEGQVRARKRFAVLIPICLGVILFLLYLNFRSWPTVLNVFAAVPVVIAGGLILIWAFPYLWDAAYAIGIAPQPSSGPIYITVAVIVGFIALLGIATDDGVVMATYLQQVFRRKKVRGIRDIRERVIEAGLRRVRPCLMTTFTTIIALMPILLSSGTGSDVAKPMAIPAVGGMLAELISLFIVPCVYCLVKEVKWRMGWHDSDFERGADPV
ncbi:MAG: efflux RND transporter permease subunit [Planctomycetota bacterium]|jgi:Cu(I)/Ag(I) efflux system membrane protein CusA/SilA